MNIRFHMMTHLKENEIFGTFFAIRVGNLIKENFRKLNHECS
jgi:hypothetical protein